MHLAHSVFLTKRPFSITLTFWRLGLNVRLVARCEKERLWPKVVVLPQLLHLAIRGYSFLTMIPMPAWVILGRLSFNEARHFTIQNSQLQDKMLKYRQRFPEIQVPGLKRNLSRN